MRLLTAHDGVYHLCWLVGQLKKMVLGPEQGFVTSITGVYGLTYNLSL